MEPSEPQSPIRRVTPPDHGRELPLWTVLAVAAGVLLAGFGSSPTDTPRAGRDAAPAEGRVASESMVRTASGDEVPEDVQLARVRGQGDRGTVPGEAAERPGGSRGLSEKPAERGSIEVGPERTAPSIHSGGVDARTRETGGYVNGLRHGEWITRDGAGVIRERGTYDAGRRVGAWESYCARGALVEVTEFAEGVKQGAWRAFAPDGDVIGEGRHRDGLRFEEWTLWYSDGRVKERGAYVNGLREGFWEFFDDLGELTHRSGAYRAGIKID